jgi:predicted lipoprotein with Yx(FWY)xxD motif
VDDRKKEEVFRREIKDWVRKRKQELVNKERKDEEKMDTHTKGNVQSPLSILQHSPSRLKEEKNKTNSKKRPKTSSGVLRKSEMDLKRQEYKGYLYEEMVAIPNWVKMEGRGRRGREEEEGGGEEEDFLLGDKDGEGEFAVDKNFEQMIEKDVDYYNDRLKVKEKEKNKTKTLKKSGTMNNHHKKDGLNENSKRSTQLDIMVPNSQNLTFLNVDYNNGKASPSSLKTSKILIDDKGNEVAVNKNSNNNNNNCNSNYNMDLFLTSVEASDGSFNTFNRENSQKNYYYKQPFYDFKNSNHGSLDGNVDFRALGGSNSIMINPFYPEYPILSSLLKK